MRQITVFTPTYNRAYCLHQLYDSLVGQTNSSFIWMVVDDGSTDNTRELVESWIAESKIQIEYHFKSNGGMHTGHNYALERITTPLNVCIDSDDYMPLDAIEKILAFWEANQAEQYAGIIGLDVYKDGRRVSNKSFPEGVKAGKYYQLKGKYGISGDLKFVYRTDVIKKYPAYPVFENERFTPLNYKYMLIDQDYDMLFLNEPLCVVEYMEDGSTRNIFKQYFRHPRGFLHERKMRMQYAYTWKERFKNCIHFVSTKIYLKENWLKGSTNLPLTILAVPFGIALHIYLRNKVKSL